MIINTIEFKDNISDEKLTELKNLTEKEFDNRAGKVKNSCLEKRKMIFKADFKDYCVIALGNLAINELQNIKNNIKAWTWEDDEERVNIFEEYSKTINF